ncbi:uncharacterized protein [Phaseolus vulgaris]|uniref:uncharacterized protein n=1 Tax=Phaseolus vulgaris TaxID=3885 RepID=UPI0035CBE7C5
MSGTPQQNGVSERVPSKAVQKTLFELWTGRKPSLRHLHVWGCSTRIVKTKNARFFENGETSRSEASQNVEIKEVRVQIPLTSTSTSKSENDLGIDNDPVSFLEAINGDNSNKWLDAMKDELKSMAHNDMNNIPYAFVVVSLVYAQTCTRPYIRFAVDSDFARCMETRKSTFGYVYLLAGGAISWKSVKQLVIVASTMEVEFVACFVATIQANWL